MMSMGLPVAISSAVPNDYPSLGGSVGFAGYALGAVRRPSSLVEVDGSVEVAERSEDGAVVGPGPELAGFRPDLAHPIILDVEALVRTIAEEASIALMEGLQGECPLVRPNFWCVARRGDRVWVDLPDGPCAVPLDRSIVARVRLRDGLKLFDRAYRSLVCGPAHQALVNYVAKVLRGSIACVSASQQVPLVGAVGAVSSPVGSPWRVRAVLYYDPETLTQRLDFDLLLGVLS